MWTIMKSLFVCVFWPRLKPHPNVYWWWLHQKPSLDRKLLLRECTSDVFGKSNSSQGVGSKSFLLLMWEGTRQEWLVPKRWVGGENNYYISTIPTSIKTLLTSIAIEIGPTITKINGWVHHETSKRRAPELPAVPPSWGQCPVMYLVWCLSHWLDFSLDLVCLC